MAVQGLEHKVIVQIGMVVDDAERMVANYKDVLGFTIPEAYHITGRYDETGATYYGQPTDGRCKLCVFNIGAVSVEFLQPLDGESVWRDFLDQHGPGIHHIAFPAVGSDAVAASFAAHGYGIAQQGRFDGGSYTYLDTEGDLGVVLELLEFDDGPKWPQGPAFDPAQGIGTDVITQIAVMTHDIAATSQRIADLLGLPVPPLIDVPGYEKSKTTFRGQPTGATCKLAFFDMGQMQLELIEPDDKPSIWRAHLDKHGPSVQHIAFQIKDTQRVTDTLAGKGIAVSQQGLYADASGMYTYVDSDKLLGTTLELLENF